MYPQHSLQLVAHELTQLKHLVQAHRTPQAIARRAQLIEASHTHPDWGTKQMARALQIERHYSKDQILEAYLNLAPYGGNV